MADYTTLVNIKKILAITSTDANDDSVIEQLIDAASNLMDVQTGRVFVSASATRTYDVPDDGRCLYVDDFTSLTSITNGDGTSIATSDVLLLPNNYATKYAIRIKASSTAYFVPVTASGETIQAISVVANWGSFASCPADVRTAVEDIVVVKYKSRAGAGVEGVATVTAAGVVLTPKDITPYAQKVINQYRRIL